MNVLQDKSSSDLLGLLGLGYSVGEWAQLTNILESHIIGDPTFIFKGDQGSRKINLRSSDISYWLTIFKEEQHPDIKGVALQKLFNLKYAALPQLLTETYHSSPYAMLRLQVYHLLQFYNDGRFEELLKTSVYDPYEFIRRKSTYSMGRIGKDVFIPYVASIYLNDGLDERVRFNAEFCFDLMDIKKLKSEVLSQIESSTSLYDKEKIKIEFTKKIDSRMRISEMGLDVANQNLKMSSRLMGVNSLRNNSYHMMTDNYLKVLGNPDENLNLRIKLAEALGWFTLSHRKGDIINSCKSIANQVGIDTKLKDELLKTANRLEVYMR